MTTLAELRLANLREQKKSAEEPAAVPEPAVEANPEIEAAPQSVLITSVPPAPALREDDLVLSQYLADGTAPNGASPPADDPDGERS